jgi:predicted HicB family RNase H-like nuclease
MAKNKKNIDSFNGFTFGTSEGEPSEVKPDQKETKAIGNQQTTEPQGGTATKKRGRPKVNRETKKRISFTILPSLYEQASEIAYNEGKSVSELISEFLKKYIKTHQ